MLVAGAFAGIAAGLLGIGGGLIIVPALAHIFGYMDFPDAAVMQMAIGTSLATIVATSISSVGAHHRFGAVMWPVFRRLSGGIVIGALFGALLATALPGQVLQTVFGVFEILVAAQLALRLRPDPRWSMPGNVGMPATGAGIGFFSAVVGIGGGTLTVPFLLACRIPIRKAVATSAACGLPIAIAGATGFMVMGWRHPDLPAWSSGYVYWPAWIGIVATSTLFAPLGARLAHTLNLELLRRIFAVFLIVVGLKMLTAA